MRRSVAAWAVALAAVAAVGTAFKGPHGDLFMQLNGQKTLGLPLDLLLVDDGELTASANLASSVAVPANVNKAYLNWKSALTMYYNMTVVSLNPETLPTPLLSVPATGRIGLAYSELILTMDCKRNGEVRMKLDLTLSDNSTKYTPVSLVFAKECDVTDAQAKSLPAACTPSNAGGLPAFSGDIKVATYDISGFTNTAAPDNNAKLGAEVAKVLLAENLDIIALQNVWSSAVRDNIADAFTAAGTYSHVIKSIGADFASDSGMMFISKLPVRWCAHKVFGHVSGSDALTAKGVFNVLVDAGAGFSYMFSVVSMQIGGGSADADIRAKQATQVAADTKAAVSRLKDGTDKIATLFRPEKMGVIMLGTTNVNTVTVSGGSVTADGSTEWTNVKAKLGGIRDMYREVNPFTTASPGLTTASLATATCEKSVNYEVLECTDGAAINFPGGKFDAFWTWNKLDDLVTNNVLVKSAAVTKFESDAYMAVGSTGYAYYGSFKLKSLSRHFMVSGTIGQSQPGGAATATPSLLAAMVAVVAAVAAQRM